MSSSCGRTASPGRSRSRCATSTAAATRGWRSPATCRSRARRCSATTSSSGPPRRSPRSSSPAASPSLPRPDPSAAMQRRGTPSRSLPRPLDKLLRDASRALCIGIGGGGDVVGALAAADLAERLGTEAIVGGITWERRPIDPIPGPRALSEVDGLAERLNDVVGLAGPATTGPGGFRFAEGGMAEALGEPTVLVDPNPGPRAVAAGLDDAAARLGCDLIVLLDVGGDVLAHGGEAGLASPLADAVLLATARHLRTPSVLAVFGAGCDGELRPAEVLERIAEVTAAGGLLGVWGLTADAADRLEQAIEHVPTEASAMAVRCARGGFGEV